MVKKVIDRNIKSALNIVAKIDSLVAMQIQAGGYSADGVLFYRSGFLEATFIENSRTGGIWDIKNMPEASSFSSAEIARNAGHFSFGANAAAFGFSKIYTHLGGELYLLYDVGKFEDNIYRNLWDQGRDYFEKGCYK